MTCSNKNITEYLINNPNIDLSAQDKLNQTPFQIGTFLTIYLQALLMLTTRLDILK
jgi:hypothetical protein